MRRTTYVLAVGILAGVLVLPAWSQEPSHRVQLTWDAPTTMADSDVPIPEGMLSHYVVYMCEAPIEAGGPDLDNPEVEVAHCTETIQTQDVTDPRAVAEFSMTHPDNRVYFRISAKMKSGLESKLSNQAIFPDDLRKVSGPPTNAVIDLVAPSQ